MTGRPVPWLDYAAACAAVGPRPATNYRNPVACPNCGQRRPEEQPDRFCIPCRNQGHTYRLMDAAELRWRAAVWRAQGYPTMAAWVLEVAEQV